MSPTSVDIVVRNFEAWGRDDLDAWLATLDPAVEWDTALGRLIDGVARVYRGHDGMRELWHSYRTEFDHFRSEVQEIQETGDDDVVVLLGRFEWRSPGSGLMCESNVGMIMAVRDGKITHTKGYFSHREALAAAGLRRWRSSAHPPGVGSPLGPAPVQHPDDANR
jgi:ketosteroid isomerase-like protein